MSDTKDITINVQELEPRVRHQTIFDTFNTLKFGESLVIHNNHDPQPVYYQLLDLRGNIFTWEYLQQGPEWWDIRVTRAVPMVPGENGEVIINVPFIKPQNKHATIFHIFENMQPGESFIIHNDHDPKPLYYQLLDKHGETFDWEYLQQGPQWFDIKVTVHEPEPIGREGEIVVNVPSLQPQVKHATIFQTYENLKPGDSFIVHNDHDPKPLYYQLVNMHGEEAFTWEYLQQRPHWFDIRITKMDH